MDEYQKEAAKTAIYPREHAVTYPIIGLANESGEALGKLKKVLRGDKTMDEQRESIIDECGDVYWYLANTASDLGISLSELARRNLDKLRKRKESGTLQGDGDKR
jgi:NTP pyrophosphatase (non-canonical NTP hydrolase)